MEYSSKHFDIIGSLWFYSKDEASNFDDDIANTDKFKSLKYKAKLWKNTVAPPAPDEENGVFKKMQQLLCHENF